jgi:hypothetical protein
MIEKPIAAILMNCDNQIVIVKVKSYKDNMKSSKHVKRRLMYVRERKNFGVIALNYVQTAKNLIVDLATREMGLRPT